MRGRGGCGWAGWVRLAGMCLGGFWRMWVDRMGDEAGVPVGYEGRGWSRGGCGWAGWVRLAGMCLGGFWRMWVDRMGDEAVVPVRYEGCGWSWGRGGCGRALVSPPSLSPLIRAWFPTNIACDVHINLANAEVGSLESQRLWRLMKTGQGKLRATFLGECRMCRPSLSLNLVPSR